MKSCKSDKQCARQKTAYNYVRPLLLDTSHSSFFPLSPPVTSASTVMTWAVNRWLVPNGECWFSQRCENKPGVSSPHLSLLFPSFLQPHFHVAINLFQWWHRWYWNLPLTARQTNHVCVSICTVYWEHNEFPLSNDLCVIMVHVWWFNYVYI